MSNKVQGLVEKIVGPNKGGFYALKVAGDDNWYGAGKYPPKCKERENVEFEVVQNGDYFNLDYKTLKVLAESRPVQASAPSKDITSYSSAARPAAPASKDDYWRRREDADVEERAYRRERDASVQNEIRFQAARNSAIEFMNMLFQHGLFTLPVSANKKTSPATVAKIHLDKFTEEFFQDTVAVNSKKVVDAIKTEVISGEEDF